MGQITWSHLRYQREEQFYSRLRPVLEKVRGKFREVSRRSQQLEKEFFKHLSHSIKIDRLPGMAAVLKGLEQRLQVGRKINLFLFQSPVSQALCCPRHGNGRGGDRDEVVLLVSQHFLNNLDVNEQLCILGHELAHVLLGHVDIPSKAVLEMETPLADTGSLKSDLLKWLTCAEISCDLIAFLASGRNEEAFCWAMLQYTTGLSGRELTVSRQRSDLVELLLSQFDEISRAVFDASITTHPLTPLRLKVVKAVAKADLIRQFGETVAPEVLSGYRKEYNQAIDAEVASIYPEIVPAKEVHAESLLFDLCVAVALADGTISTPEVNAIGEILGHRPSAQEKARVKRLASDATSDEAVRRLLNQALQQAKKEKHSKRDIIGMLRQMIIVAASDGRIEKVELDVVHEYARHFGFTKGEIVVLVSQLGFS